MSQTDEELREKLFQAPDEWFDAHTMGGEIECVHLTNKGIEAIMQLIKARDAAKERELLGLPEDGKWYDISLQAKAAERVLIANYQRRESDKEEL